MYVKTSTSLTRGSLWTHTSILNYSLFVSWSQILRTQDPITKSHEVRQWSRPRNHQTNVHRIFMERGGEKSLARRKKKDFYCRRGDHRSDSVGLVFRLDVSGVDLVLNLCSTGCRNYQGTYGNLRSSRVSHRCTMGRRCNNSITTITYTSTRIDLMFFVYDLVDRVENGLHES